MRRDTAILKYEFEFDATGDRVYEQEFVVDYTVEDFIKFQKSIKQNVDEDTIRSLWESNYIEVGHEDNGDCAFINYLHDLYYDEAREQCRFDNDINRKEAWEGQW